MATNKVLTGSARRRKGADFERAMVRYFKRVFPDTEVERGLQSRDGGECPDVAAGKLWIECKVGKMTSVKRALKQARQDAAKKTIPVAICQDDFARPVIAMDLRDFVNLVRAGSIK